MLFVQGRPPAAVIPLAGKRSSNWETYSLYSGGDLLPIFRKRDYLQLLLFPYQ